MRFENAGHVCSSKDCTDSAIVRGMCRKHYQQWQKRGHTSPAGTILREKRPCLVEGCERPHSAIGLCKLHYSRFRKTGTTEYTNSRIKYSISEAGIRDSYVGNQGEARRKGLVWNISFEDYSRLVLQDCTFCGAAPTLRFGQRGEYHQNGIDREDSARGYTLDNVTPCCRTCNRMKATYTTHEFLEHITRIIEYMNRVQRRVVSSVEI